MLNGFDASNWQTPDQVADGDFVIAKIGEGLSYQDPGYLGHQAAARARGQGFGGYWLSWPCFDPVTCARNAVRLSGLRVGELFMDDFEPLTVQKKMAAYGKWDPRTWPAWICAYNAEVARLLQRPVLQYLNDWHAHVVFQYATLDQATAIRSALLVKAGRDNLYVTSPTDEDGKLEPGDLHGWDHAAVFQWTDGSTLTPPESLDRDVFDGTATDWRALGGIPGWKDSSMTYYTACGYSALSSFPASFVAPNGHVTSCRHNDAAVIAARLAWRLDTEVAKLTGAFGGRTIAQQEATYRQLRLPCNYTSSHLAGLAWDLGNGRQVFEPNQTGTYSTGYTSAQYDQIRVILRSDEFGGIIQWGNDFTSPYRDPVHYQIFQRYPYGSGPYPVVVSRSKIASVAKGIRAWVKAVQSACGVTADGVAGPGTIAAVRKFQSAHGLTADGIVGPATEAAMFPVKPDTPAKPKPAGDLVVDGEFGPTSVATMQKQLGLTPDGKISSQSTSAGRLVRHGILPAAIEYVAPSKAKGSQTVVALQKHVGIKHPTGKLTKPTIRAIQTWLGQNGFVLSGENPGIWDKPLSVRMQRALNEGLFK